MPRGGVSDRSPLLPSDKAPQATTGERPTAYLLLVATLAALSAFNYGYHIGVMNTPELVIRNCTLEVTEGLPPCFNISSTIWGMVIAVFSLGGMIGGMFGGPLSDRFGRKAVIFWNSLNFIIGSVFLATATSEVMLIIGRIFVGVGSGVATTVVPTYIGEITPPNLRGAFGVLFQLSITVGILVAQTISLYMSTTELWRWLLSLGGFVAIIQMSFLFLTVDSPRYLLLRGKSSEAESALRRLFGRADVSAELEAMQQGILISGTSKYSVRELLRDGSLRRPLLVGVGLLVAQQLSGINAVFYYSTSIFASIFPDAADRLTVSIGILNVAMTVLAVFLMDRAGRRALLLVCEVGMIIFATLFVIAFVFVIDWLSIVCIYGYVATFAIGLGPVPYLILSEMIPTKAIGSASSIGLSLNWLSNFSVALLFPLMDESLGDYSFLPFAAIIVVFLILTIFFVPETKGRSIEEITKEYGSSINSD